MPEMQTRYHPHEVGVTLTGGTDLLTIKGASVPGTRAVRLDALSYDEGKVAGAVIQDVRVKIVPKGHPGAFGGSIFHTFYAVPSKTNNRNVIPLGGLLIDPDEDVDLELIGTAGAIRLRLERTLLGRFAA